MTAEPVLLIGRMDDAGSCPSANEAIEEVLRTGWARNVSVMACAPHFDEAAAMLRRHPEACIGLHVTLHAEWDAVKWGPVLPPAKVRSLVDVAGHFLPNPMASHQRGLNLDEFRAELDAQLAAMRGADLRVDYFDLHMCFDWMAGVREVLVEFSKREGIPAGHNTVLPLPDVEGRFEDVGDEIIARLAACAGGPRLLVGHPGYDRRDMQRLGHTGLAPGQVARERVRQRLAFQSPKVVEYARTHGIRFASYTDVLDPP